MQGFALSEWAYGNVQFLPGSYLGKIFPALGKSSEKVNLSAK